MQRRWDVGARRWGPRRSSRFTKAREAAKGDLERAAKENRRPGSPVNPDYKDKYLQVHFTVEDERSSPVADPAQTGTC
jgi:hypothetical protein